MHMDSKANAGCGLVGSSPAAPTSKHPARSVLGGVRRAVCVSGICRCLRGSLPSVHATKAAGLCMVGLQGMGAAGVGMLGRESGVKHTCAAE